MLMCPTCRSEYVSGITRCRPCGEDLVEPATLEQRDVGSPRAALEGVPTVQISGSSLTACRELERVLMGAGVLAFVQTKDGCAPKGGCACEYVVVIAREDAERASQVLAGRFQDLVEREGVGSIVNAAVDLEAEEVTCPACGHTGALADDGTCGDCGLMLGVPA